MYSTSDDDDDDVAEDDARPHGPLLTLTAHFLLAEPGDAAWRHAVLAPPSPDKHP